MKTLAEVRTNLLGFQNLYGINLAEAQQGSPEWLTAKLGVISASNASKVVAKKDSGTRATYLAELVGQVCTGVGDEIHGDALSWGKEHEDAARASYEFATQDLILEVPFIFRDEKFREGCSPDGLIVGKPKGLELKCPFKTVHYIHFLTGGISKSEYDWQVQFQMRATGAEVWDLGQFDPRMKAKPLHYVTVERDEKKQATLNDAVPQFLEDMDKMLAKIGVEFGAQWKREGAQ